MLEDTAQKQFYESFSKELLGKFQRLHNLIPDHHESTGNYHEEILRVSLRNFLSKRYSVKTGFIYGGDNRLSRQIDILVVDEQAPVAYLFQEGEFAVVAPEAVVAVIEVKTTLDKTAFKDAVNNILKAKGVLDYPNRVTGIIFGFQKSIKNNIPLTKRMMDSWFKDGPWENTDVDKYFLGPDAIFWLNTNFAMMPYIPEGNSIGGTNKYYGIYHNQNEINGWQITQMLMLISQACRVTDANYRRFSDQGKQTTALHRRFIDLSYTDSSYILGEGETGTQA